MDIKDALQKKLTRKAFLKLLFGAGLLALFSQTVLAKMYLRKSTGSMVEVDNVADLTAGNVWTGANDFGGAELEIPNGNPTVDTTGDIGFDTTNGQLLVYDGTAARVLASDIKTITATIESPAADDVIPMFQTKGVALTLISVRGTVLGGTNYVFNVEERAAASLNSSGTDTLTSDLTAVQGGAESSTFTNSGIAADAFMVIVATSMSGTPDTVTVRLEYREDRT